MFLSGTSVQFVLFLFLDRNSRIQYECDQKQILLAVSKHKKDLIGATSVPFLHGSPRNSLLSRPQDAQKMETVLKRPARYLNNDKEIQHILQLANESIQKKNVESAILAEDLLWQLVAKSSYYNMENDRPTPNDHNRVANAILFAYSKHGEAERAENMLSKMERLHRSSRLTSSNTTLHSSSFPLLVQPTVETFNLVMSAYLHRNKKLKPNKNTNSEDALQVENLLHRISKAPANGVNDNVRPKLFLQPDTVSYTSAITAWAQCSDRTAPYQAESLLLEMEHIYREQRREKSNNLEGIRVKPNVVSYTSVLSAWAKSTDFNAPIRAQALFFLMLKHHEREKRKWNKELQKNNCAGDTSSNNRVDRGCKPNTVSLNCVLHAWARHAALFYANERNDIHHGRKQTNVKKSVIYNNKQEASNNVTMISMISGRVLKEIPIYYSPAYKAQRLLRSMQSRYQLTGDVDWRPNTISYSTVLWSWAHQSKVVKGSAECCQALFDEMLLMNNASTSTEDASFCLPNTVCYNAVISAWSKSGEPDAALRCEALLKKMEDATSSLRNQYYSCRPNEITYGAVLSAWSKSQKNVTYYEQAPHLRAHALLHTMEDLFDRGQVKVGPSVISYTVLIDMYARSQSKDSPYKTAEILHHMRARLCKSKYSNTGAVTQPDVLTYTVAIKACACVNTRGTTQRERLKLFRLAQSHFQSILDSKMIPIRTTYESMILSCARLLSINNPLRKSSIFAYVQMCKDQGLWPLSNRTTIILETLRKNK